MKRTGKLGLGIAVLIAIGAWLFWGGERGAREAGAGAKGHPAADERHEPADREVTPPTPAGETRTALVAPGPAEEDASASPSGARVRTRFVDASGAAVPGVELALLDAPGASARGSSDGAAELELPAALFSGGPRRLDFEARCAGFARERRTATANPAGTLLLGDWALVAGGSIGGRVVDEQGRALAAAEVACLRADLSANGWERSRSLPIQAFARAAPLARTESDGSFLLGDAPAGRIRLVAVAARRPATCSEPVEIPAGGRGTDVVLRMEPEDGGTSIAGVVLDPEGKPLAGAIVEVSGASTRNQLTAGEDGRFDLQLGDHEPRDVRALDPAQRLREATRSGVAPGTTDLELRLTPAPETELEVRSKGGEPIELFAVALIAVKESATLAFFREREHPGGAFCVPAPGQAFRIEVRANGWMPARLGPFTPDAAPARLACTLEPAGGVHGVVTVAGKPTSGVAVSLLAAVKTKVSYNGFPLHVRKDALVDTSSDARGAYELSVEAPGTYYLRAEGEGFAPAELGPLELAPDSDREQDFALDQGGALAVRVRSSSGASVAGLLVAFSRGDGFACTARTDEEGAAGFAELIPGPWQVVLSKTEIDARFGATYESEDRADEIPSNCRVFAGETTHVDLWLEGGAEKCRLSGRLTIDGKPAEGWRAQLQRERTALGEARAFVEPGLFRLGADLPGSYRLLLTTDATDPSTMLMVLDPVELFEGERFWSLEFDTAALEGTLGSAAAGGENALLFYRWERGKLLCLAPIAPDASGRFRCARVPAGRGSLVRYDASRPFEEQTPAVLRELETKKGETTKVEL